MIAWKCRYLYWIKDLVREATQPDRRRVHPFLLDVGPFGVMTRAMQRYRLSWRDLAKTDYANTEKDDAGTPGGLKKWRDHCRTAVKSAWCSEGVQEGQALRRDSPLRLHYPQDEDEAAKAKLILPRFLAKAGDLGRAGLRLLAPTLRSGWDPNHGKCGLCGSRGEPTLPAHLTRCTASPPNLQKARRQVARKRL